MTCTMTQTLRHTGALWLWKSGDSAGGWHFLTIDGEAGEAIAAHEAMRRLELGGRRGFGSVKVEATIGQTRWATSVFPSKSRDGYLLPVKASVRRKEALAAGEEANVMLTLL